MTGDFAALESLRLGCVQYLNAKPLICAYRGNVIFEHPARLAEMLALGELDIALVPTFEALRQPDFRAVDGVSISSRGPVYSVFLAHRGPLEKIKTIALDPASRTSTHLLQCLIAEYHDFKPEYLQGRDENADAWLLIGDQAIRFRAENGSRFDYLDLGEEWARRALLPFVFAVWMMRPEVPETAADALRALKCAGVKCIGEIARDQADMAFAERYLTEHIRFDLGETERLGIEKFRGLLMKHSLLPDYGTAMHFV